MPKKAILIGFFVAISLAIASAQPQTDTIIDPLQQELKELWLRSTAHLADTALGLQIRNTLQEYFAYTNQITAKLPTLDGLSDLIAPDKKIRLITWTHALPNDETLYQGLALYQDTNDSLQFYPLTDRQLPVGNGLIDEKWFVTNNPPTEWLGAVYYAIQPFSFQGTSAYILLGVAGHTSLCTRKIVETVYIDEADQLQFGLPCLAYSRTKIFRRILYTYSARVAMTLQLMDNGKTILIDHLAPAAPQYVGLPQFYGPDASQDAFRLSESGYWIYENDVLAAPEQDRETNRKHEYMRGF